MDTVLSHSMFMTECSEPTEAYSYITRAVIHTFGPDAKARNCVCATDSDSSLPAVGLRENLHTIRPKILGSVTGFGGSKILDSIWDTIIPHNIVGSPILMSAVVDDGNLPSGYSFLIGCPRLNMLGIDLHELSHAPPSVVPRVMHRFRPPPTMATFCHAVRDAKGNWHPVCWNSVLDSRISVQACVVFKDGSTLLVRVTCLHEMNGKKPVKSTDVVPPQYVKTRMP